MRVFGSYRKLGQTENVLCVDCKIRAHRCKMFSGFIFTSNNFRKPCLKRESLSTLLTWFETHIQAPTSPDCATPRSKTPLQAYLQTISKKKKKKRTKPQIVKREQSRWDRAHNPKSHWSRRTPASARSHPSTCQIAPPEALVRSRSLKHHWDCTPALARSHPWPTHTWSLSFSIYLSLSLNCRSLSSSLSLFIWPNFWVQWMFCFDFCFI